MSAPSPTHRSDPAQAGTTTQHTDHGKPDSAEGRALKSAFPCAGFSVQKKPRLAVIVHHCVSCLSDGRCCGNNMVCAYCNRWTETVPSLALMVVWRIKTAMNLHVLEVPFSVSHFLPLVVFLCSVYSKTPSIDTSVFHPSLSPYTINFHFQFFFCKRPCLETKKKKNHLKGKIKFCQ